jgi:hypothetical protein
MKLDIWGLFENLSRKSKFHSNLTRIPGTLHEDVYTFLIMYEFFLEWDTFCTKIIQKIKRYVLSSIILFRKSCRLRGNKCVIAYPLQQLLREGATMIRYWYIAYLLCITTAVTFASETQVLHMAIPNLLYTAIKHCYSALVCAALKDDCFVQLLNIVVHTFCRLKIMIATEVSLYSYATCVRFWCVRCSPKDYGHQWLKWNGYEDI